MTQASRGALVVIEGLDRAGKSTQHGRLCDHLESQGYPIKRMRFPDRSTPIGATISSYLKGASDLEDHAIHLLFSANRWEAAPSIVDAIDAGTTVVIDRYYYSGIVYTAAKGKSHLDLQWSKGPDVGLPRPDLIVFLDIDSETASTRGGFGEERYEKKDMQKRIRQLFYEAIAMEEKGSKVTHVVDASKSLDVVASDVRRIAEDVYNGEKLKGPLRRLKP